MRMMKRNTLRMWTKCQGESKKQADKSEGPKPAASWLSEHFHPSVVLFVRTVLQSKPGWKKKKGFKDESSMFGAAEEFGYLLDENTGSKFDNIGINAVANQAKADIKQLKWETQRDDWLCGRDAKTLRKKKTMFKRKKPLGKLKARK
ncbi:CCAAT/enhancer-binding protein zeta-like isoform X3 [Acipenser ruthenus]|uniref:CCAAT/enhancer-binding protein zeta-like isoform X3 n=1 Tax=Acipenser ruthenus TaxID=7906 RepID=UPI00274202D9|nr:CCAAT/enhancer-binding protein zeta-like isoform X3 [Acipenser ruthenus]